MEDNSTNWWLQRSPEWCLEPEVLAWLEAVRLSCGLAEAPETLWLGEEGRGHTEPSEMLMCSVLDVWWGPLMQAETPPTHVHTLTLPHCHPPGPQAHLLSSRLVFKWFLLLPNNHR